MTILTLDIETRPCDDPTLIEEIISLVRPPRTITRTESIAAWWKENGEAAKQEAVARTSFDGTYGRICCIGYAFDDSPAEAHCGEEDIVIRKFFLDVTEAAMVKHYDAPVKVHTIVGHNVSAFDLRFLWQRAVILGIPRPQAIPWQAKPWELQDTMVMWNPDREKRISLDKLCKVLGIKSPKGDLDGSKIAQAWADGRHDDIAHYCKADVDATRACWQKLTSSSA